MVAAAFRRSGRHGPSNVGPGGGESATFVDSSSCAHLWGRDQLLGTRPAPLNVLAADDEPEDVDVDLEDKGATGEVITRGSVAAEADWISRASSSSLSGSNARGNFGVGATAERGGAEIVGIS
jgi:hypothetical protein